jgi:hypothetical protein
LVTDVYVTNSGSAFDLNSAVRSSSLTIDWRTVVWTAVWTGKLHFSFGSNWVKVNSDQVVTWDVKVSFFDSTTRTNEAFRLIIDDGVGVGSGEVAGTTKGMRILWESTGVEIERAGVVISWNQHLLSRSKPTVAMSTFTPWITDAYRFTVTADANRKLTLTGLTLEVGGSVTYSGGIVAVYRDSVGGSNLVGTGDLTTIKSNGTIDLTNAVVSKEIPAGSTVTFYVQFENSEGNFETSTQTPTREVRVRWLKYFDDVTTPQDIEVSIYNVWIPTNVSSYTYGR